MFRALFGSNATPAQQVSVDDAPNPFTNTIPMKRQQDVEERKKEASAIKDLEMQICEQDISKVYVNVASEYSDYIQEMTTDAHLEYGFSDNRPCNQGHSRVHKLKCGHTVYSESSTMCGRNCDLYEFKDNSPLYCVLCVRDGLTRRRKQFPKRWHDVLLPSFHDPEAEAKDVEDYALITRKTEPAYIGQGGVLLLPKSPLLVAMIRAAEWQREQQLKARIREACALEHYNKRITSAAVENFEVLLSNHQLLSYANLAIIAALSFKLTLTFEHVLVRYGAVAEVFNAPRSMYEGMYQVTGHNILCHLVAQQKIEVFLRKVPPKYRRDNKFQKDGIEVVARRIRARALTHLKFKPQQRQELFDYIIAASIQPAMAQFRIHITMREVCEVMEVEYDGSVDEGDKTNRRAKAKKVNVSAAGEVSKADFAERLLQQFTAGRDWKKATGTVKDERKKLKEKKAKAERETQGIDGAMAALSGF